MKAELNRMGRIRLFPLLCQNGCSRFLPQARRIVDSGDENGSSPANRASPAHVIRPLGPDYMSRAGVSLPGSRHVC